MIGETARAGAFSLSGQSVLITGGGTGAVIVANGGSTIVGVGTLAFSRTGT